jgi:hypothetical protein
MSRKADKLKNIQDANMSRLGENSALGGKKQEEYQNMLFDILHNRDRHDPVRQELESFLDRIESEDSEGGSQWSSTERDGLNDILRNSNEI